MHCELNQPFSSFHHTKSNWMPQGWMCTIITRLHGLPFCLGVVISAFCPKENITNSSKPHNCLHTDVMSRNSADDEKMPNRLLGTHSYRAQWGSLWPLQNQHLMNRKATVQRCSALFLNEIMWNEMFCIPFCFGLSEERDMMVTKVRSQMLM